MSVVPAAGQSPSAAPHDTAAEFSYEGDTGPGHWASLDPSYAACAGGTAQSPIDITDPVPADLADLAFGYVAGEARVVNNGHTVQANAAPGSTLTLDGEVFALVQLHFHAPSEHRIYGLTAPVEAHFVHATPEGELAVVGVMLVEGPEPNSAWDPYVSVLGLSEGAEQTATIDWDALLPAARLSFRYPGSLTTPPCSEGVRWQVLAQPVELGAAQVAAFTAAYSGNNRPTQSLNDRVVEVDTTGG